MKFYIIDLERSEANKIVHFWRKNGMGYTTNITDAGIYTCDDARMNCESDITGETIMIDKYSAEHIYNFIKSNNDNEVVKDIGVEIYKKFGGN